MPFFSLESEVYDVKEESVSNELIEPEILPNHVEVKMEKDEDGLCQDVPQVIVQSEDSKPSDINESNWYLFIF